MKITHRLDGAIRMKKPEHGPARGFSTPGQLGASTALRSQHGHPMPFGEGHRFILAAPIHHQHLCPSSRAGARAAAGWADSFVWGRNDDGQGRRHGQRWGRQTS